MKKLLTLSIAIISIFTLAGCNLYGGGQATPEVVPSQTTSAENTTASNTATNSNASVQSFDVSIVEFAFAPNEFRLKVGEPTEFNLSNDGSMLHTFTVPDLGVDERLNAGESLTITITPEVAGSFELFCNILGHKQRGQVGTIIVE